MLLIQMFNKLRKINKEVRKTQCVKIGQLWTSEVRNIAVQFLKINKENNFQT